MPAANNWAGDGSRLPVGDGLNTAAYRFVRGRQGDTGANVTTGQDLNSNRWQFNLKIDHNFSAKEKIREAGRMKERHLQRFDQLAQSGSYKFSAIRRY
jgi:hypothetical protein